MIRAYWRNFIDLCKHKYWVFKGCQRMGVHLHRALWHDWSKLLPSEFGPYADWFHNGGQDLWKGGAAIWDRRRRWQEALMRHCNRHDHHPSHWRMPDGEVLPMSDQARREMVADWYGAGAARTPGYTWADVAGWYAKAGGNLPLHPDTRAWVEQRLQEMQP